MSGCYRGALAIGSAAFALVAFSGHVFAEDLIKEAVTAMSHRDYATACSAMMTYADQTTYFIATGKDNMVALARGVSPDRYLASARAAEAAQDHNAACAYDLLAAAAYKTPAYRGNAEYIQNHVSEAIHAAKAERAATPAAMGPGAPGYADYQPGSAKAAPPPSAPALPNPSLTPAPAAASTSSPAAAASPGDPAACLVDWSHSGPLSQRCADAEFARADAEWKAGNCAAAVQDYRKARTAAQNAGTIVNMTLRTNDGYNACTQQLNPALKAQQVPYGFEGVVPNGTYTCYSYPSVISAGPINTTVSLGQQTGAVWIYSNTIYANGSAAYTGHYAMRGNQIVASDGPFYKNNVVAFYVPDGLYHRKTILMGYSDGKGGSLANSACTYNGK